jgi:hypothetical protein
MRKIIVYALTGMLGFVMALGLVLATGSQAQAAVHRMQIHEIYYNSPGPDHGGNSSLNHEWVQLHNNRVRRSTWPAGRCATKQVMSLNSALTR